MCGSCSISGCLQTCINFLYLSIGLSSPIIFLVALGWWFPAGPVLVNINKVLSCIGVHRLREVTDSGLYG